MTVSYVGSTNSDSGGNAGTAVSFSIPSGTTNGDLLVLYLGICDPTSGSAGAQNITSGLADWTSGLNNNLASGDRQRLRVLYTIYNSGTTTTSATLGGSSAWVASVSTYRDAGGIGVANVSGNNSGVSGTTIATLTKSPATSGVDWISCGFLTNSTTGRTWTEDIGNERTDSNSGAATRVVSLSTTDYGPISSGTVITGTVSGAATTGRTACSLVITGTAGGGGALTNDPADAEGLADALAKTQGKAVGDSAGLTDAAAKSEAKVVGDAEGLADAVSVAVSASRAAGDTEGLTDSVSAALGLSVGASDAEGLADSVTGMLTRHGGADDAEGLTDSVTFQVVAVTPVADAEALADGVSRMVEYARGAGDAEGLTDSVASSVGKSSSLGDALGLVDGVSYSVRTPQDVTSEQVEEVGLTDSLTAILSGSVNLSRVSQVYDEGRISVVPNEVRIEVVT